MAMIDDLVLSQKSFERLISKLKLSHNDALQLTLDDIDALKNSKCKESKDGLAALARSAQDKLRDMSFETPARSNEFSQKHKDYIDGIEKSDRLTCEGISHVTEELKCLLEKYGSFKALYDTDDTDDTVTPKKKGTKKGKVGKNVKAANPENSVDSELVTNLEPVKKFLDFRGTSIPEFINSFRDIAKRSKGCIDRVNAYQPNPESISLYLPENFTSSGLSQKKKKL